MGKSTREIQKKAVARWLANRKCQEPGCKEDIYVARGKELTRCAKHAQEHDDREAKRKEDFRVDGLCSECKEHRPLEPGLATCRVCAQLTDDMVEDWYPMDPSKKSKRRSYLKMSRAKDAGRNQP